ncbi:hypothetical protein D0T49_05620 [Paludibacter sp. 221]|uniref:NVEALA domain-containing protein n=1 Tax=Paludibacter sp. 221 TaxID=2302939 RepID=UPI0013D0B036|nr:hypothetical protein [Paludibacter sp. 221]
MIIATAVFAFALVAAFNVNLNLKKESNLSVIALANLEALAGESNGGGSTGGEEFTTTCPNPAERYGNCREQFLEEKKQIGEGEYRPRLV